MARISIKDLPQDMKVSKEEIEKIQGGAAYIKHDFSLFRQTSLWSPDIYGSRPVDPPPPTPSGRLKSYFSKFR